MYGDLNQRDVPKVDFSFPGLLHKILRSHKWNLRRISHILYLQEAMFHIRLSTEDCKNANRFLWTGAVEQFLAASYCGTQNIAEAKFGCKGICYRKVQTLINPSSHLAT